VSAFMMDYTDLQVQTPIGIGVFDIRNAAAATIRGVEVENSSRLGHGIEAGGHLTWLDATYDQYIAVNNLNVTGDVSGNRLNNAPEWAGRLWIEWTGTYRVQEVGALTVRDDVAPLPNESLMVPLARVLNVRFRGGWLRPRLELSGRDLAVFETVPGEEEGIARLWLARQDREIAASLTSKINQAIAELAEA